ncbi:MAG TPA: proton-conducting membrane transporter [Lachnospiraceae bacterium]|nr:proton-conducting membrane transporter [Lachnospiraceae bacterium]
MNSIFMFIAVLIPVISAILIPVFNFKEERTRNIYIEGALLITSVIVCLLIFNIPAGDFVFARFTRSLSLSLRIDGMSRIFAGLAAFMWPLATLYAFEYMEKEKSDIFFMFYTMTYGVTLGISFAEDIFTMYFFYELLTLVTVPLVMHTLTREAVLASRTYLYYSLGGAGFAFIGMVFIISYSVDINFRYGGVLSLLRVQGRENVLLLIYVLSFLGFGVKSAIFPLGAWLPRASVAPTPVTALLHAVAVVNAGAFAIIRLTWFSFGTDFLKGTWAQRVVMGFAIVTILYSSTRAVKETHIKRRLAWSTSSNLSYILFGVTLMNPGGLMGALLHFVIHGIMKICSFFCAGAIIHRTEKNYVHELDGLAKRMPKVFLMFTASALSLMGVPGFAGFVSKWYLAAAAVSADGDAESYAGIAALLISALLTAIYMMTMLVRGYFPEKGSEMLSSDRAGRHSGDTESGTADDKLLDPGFRMMVPLIVFAALVIILGLFPGPLISFVRSAIYTR